MHFFEFPLLPAVEVVTQANRILPQELGAPHPLGSKSPWLFPLFLSAASLWSSVLCGVLTQAVSLCD